jgi:hypothetical protein
MCPLSWDKRLSGPVPPNGLSAIGFPISMTHHRDALVHAANMAMAADGKVKNNLPRAACEIQLDFERSS